MEEPRPVREIGKVAWLMTKLGLGLAAVLGALLLLSRGAPDYRRFRFCALLLAGIAVFGGWTVYKDKKKEFERVEAGSSA